MVDLRIVLRTNVTHQAPNPMMACGRPGRVTRRIAMLVAHACILEYNAMVWLQQAGTLQVDNRLLVQVIHTCTYIIS